MPDPDFLIKQGDGASRLEATVENSGGTAVSVENATVILRIAPISGGTLTVAGTAIIDQVGNGTGGTGAMGQIHYNWGANDTAVPGLYCGEWQVRFASGTVQTFPNADPFLVQVTAAIG